ncbi:DUF2642 domain-containing protein [Shouchella clausii]|uniref:DUF2642 domain-containing protein n=1 Tax=Shouchella clausii TaxID=79880 RepID=UPI000BA7A3E2|nr:DUF2642 domain-containing protein [Shouchella clausii]PAD44345.1 hypothetical protein CHH54_01685 [Bacillus sp. 7520-S]PAD92623.1 hypothetical protein CHH52_08675 [Shouchella clausii]
MANGELSLTLQLLNLLLEIRLAKLNGSTPPNGTGSIRDLLLGLVGQTVTVTTPFGVITGTLLSVLTDYIVIIEDTGSQVLVRLAEIESASGQ